jgi:hypothetical protein
MMPVTSETADSNRESQQIPTKKEEALKMDDCAAALPSPPTTPKVHHSIVKGEIFGQEISPEVKQLASQVDLKCNSISQSPIQWEWLGTCPSCLDQNILDQQTVRAYHTSGPYPNRLF